MDVKALDWISDRFPMLLALALAAWCITADRPELAMGYLILGFLSEVMRVLVEIRDEMRDASDGEST